MKWVTANKAAALLSLRPCAALLGVKGKQIINKEDFRKIQDFSGFANRWKTVLQFLEGFLPHKRITSKLYFKKWGITCRSNLTMKIKIKDTDFVSFLKNGLDLMGLNPMKLTGSSHLLRRRWGIGFCMPSAQLFIYCEPRKCMFGIWTLFSR